MWNGQTQKMHFIRGGNKVAKGMKMVLEERGVSTVGMNAQQISETLAGHADFKHEKSTWLFRRDIYPLSCQSSTLN